MPEPSFLDRLDMVRDSTVNRIAIYLAAIAKNTGGVEMNGWKYIQSLVRTGLHKDLIKVGDIFIVEKETGMSAAIGTTETEGEPGITAASVVPLTFINKIGTAHSGDYEFIFDGAEWHLGNEAVVLSEYGITVTGTAKHGDVVIIHETAARIPKVVLGINQETPSDPQFTNSLTLGDVDVYAEMQFDAGEAWYYAENGLAAGTYYFTVDPTYDATYNTYKETGYQFTLANAVPAKGVLTMSWAYNTQASGMKISSYATRSDTTAIETVSIEEGTNGTNLGQLTSAGDPTNNLNSISRVRFGSNNYNESAIRQFLNSDKAAGTYWKPQTKFDRPPSWNASSNGYLYGMDPDFVSVLGEVKKVTAKNTVADGGGTVTTDEKVFLLSMTEAYCGGSEGSPYDYFKNYSDSSSATTGADSNRIKYRNGTAKYWWLRSPYPSGASVPRGISTSGALNYNSAYYARGVVPACVIV